MPFTSILAAFAFAPIATIHPSDNDRLAKTNLDMSPRFVAAAPLPGVPAIMIDRLTTGFGLASESAKAAGRQGRMLWIDATANIDRYNTEEKVTEVVRKIHQSGFNTIVLDIKPISGEVNYRSALAPRLKEWRGRILPEDIDVLAAFLRHAKPVGLSVLVSLNAYSEGHRMFSVGPGYGKKDQQTVIYEPKSFLRIGSLTSPVASALNQVQNGAVGVFSMVDRVPQDVEGGYTVAIDRHNMVTETFEFGAKVTAPPKGGTLLYGTAQAGEWLRTYAAIGRTVSFDTEPEYVPMADWKGTQIPLMMNPNNEQVRKYALDVLSEVVANYPVDGVLYDDRLRYAGINADFSEATRTKFEKLVGKSLNWPDDVFKFTLNPNLTRGVRPGRYYDQWMAWRAQVLQEFVRDARKVVKKWRPNAVFGAYVGSWYGEYPTLGHNYAASETEASFWFLSPNYRKAGTANLFDLLVPGAYYPTPTIHEALSKGTNAGATVEAAGTLANRLARDQAWTYTGLSLSDFKDNPGGLTDSLQAAVAASQGVMVFDLSHDIDPMWEVFAKAFGKPMKAPHSDLGLLNRLRTRRSELDKKGYREPAITVTAGSAGTGH